MKFPSSASKTWIQPLLVTCLIFVSVVGCNKINSSSSGKKLESSPPISANDKARQERLNWNLQTLVMAYEKAGHTGRPWDTSAKNALTEFARLRSQVTETNERGAQIIATNCEAAVKAGCDDPLIAYLHTRFVLDQTNTPKIFADAFLKNAQDIQQSTYPSIRKFYVSLRAVQQIYYTFGTNADSQEIQAAGGRLLEYLMGALNDKTTPPGEVYEACLEGLNAYQGDKNLYEQFYNRIEKPLFENWPDESESWLLKGKAHIEMAWHDRGFSYADKVSEEGWEGFEKHLKTAEEALNQAWTLNPKDLRIANTMLVLELGQGKGRDRMELWFKRAMALDPNSYETCDQKRYYLEPKWYGSDEDMLAFGWECTESTNWGGKVPLVLLDAHEAIQRHLDKSDQDNYWTRPEVWSDIQMAFEKFFQLNPDATSWYHNYAWYAYHCGQWRKLNELIPKLGPVNYSYFGGKAEFDKMVSLAREHAGETNAEINTTLIEIYRLNTKIDAKVHEGKQTENDFADLLQQCDTLLAKHKDEKTDEVAQILFAKASLYLQVFDNAQKGRELILQLKQDFPETKLGRNADKILALIERQEEVKKINHALAEGIQFPEFNEKDTAGKPLSIANYKGKVVLVDFWATWCGPCVAELPNVQATYQKHHAQGFEIIGVSLDADQQKFESFIKQKNMTWRQYFDGQAWNNKLAIKYGIESIPATFLLDGEGKIIAKDLRGEELEQAVAKALAKK